MGGFQGGRKLREDDVTTDLTSCGPRLRVRLGEATTVVDLAAFRGGGGG